MYITYTCPKCRRLIRIEFSEDIDMDSKNQKDIEIVDYDCPSCGYEPLININIDIS